MKRSRVGRAIQLPLKLDQSIKLASHSKEIEVPPLNNLLFIIHYFYFGQLGHPKTDVLHQIKVTFFLLYVLQVGT